MLHHVVDNFPIFAPELSSAASGSADLLVDVGTDTCQQENPGTFLMNESTKPMQSNKADNLKDECLAFRSYN